MCLMSFEIKLSVMGANVNMYLLNLLSDTRDNVFQLFECISGTYRLCFTSHDHLKLRKTEELKQIESLASFCW